MRFKLIFTRIHERRIIIIFSQLTFCYSKFNWILFGGVKTRLDRSIYLENISACSNAGYTVYLSLFHKSHMRPTNVSPTRNAPSFTRRIRIPGDNRNSHHAWWKFVPRSSLARACIKYAKSSSLDRRELSSAEGSQFPCFRNEATWPAWKWSWRRTRNRTSRTRGRCTSASCWTGRTRTSARFATSTPSIE